MTTATTTFCLFGSFLGLILAAGVYSLEGGERRLNRSLALLLVLQSAGLGAIAAQHADLLADERALVLVEYMASLLVGPALLAFTRAALDLRLRVPLLIHAVPALVFLVYVVVVISAQLLGGGVELRLPPIMVLVAYMGCYTVFAAVVAFGTRGAGRPKPHRAALRVVTGSMIAIQLAQLVRFLFRDLAALDNVVPLTGALGVCCLSVVTIRSSRLFGQREKYTASGLSLQDERQTADRLLRVMDQEQLFLDHSLNLAELAKRLKVSRSHLSQVVNSRFGVNLPEFVNGYRVEEAQRLLADSTLDHLTIEAIGSRVGFRSRSAFHGAYKRAVGESPAKTRADLS